MIVRTLFGNVRRPAAFNVNDEVATDFLHGPHVVLLKMAVGRYVQRGVDTGSGSGGNRAPVEVEEFR